MGSLRAGRWLAVAGLIVLAAGHGCADGTTPTEYVRVEGRFHAMSLDGQPLPRPKREVIHQDPEGQLDTAIIMVSGITWRFHNSVDNLEMWDYVARTEGRYILGAEADTSTWTTMWRYRATVDSLWLRYVDSTLDSVIWRVPWDSFDAAFRYRTVLFDDPYQYVARFERVSPAGSTGH